MPNTANIQAPLNRLLHNTKKNYKRPVQWTEGSLEAFRKTKAGMTVAAQLAYQSTHEELCLACDASDTCIGAVLQQKKKGTWWPLSFFSRALSPSQKNYSAYYRELLAVYNAVKHFRPLLEGLNFNTITDHKPLLYAFEQKPTSACP